MPAGDDMKERVIYLKDLFLTLLKKWPVALCFVILGAVALNCYGALKAKNAAGSASYDAKLTTLKSVLTEAEAEHAESSASNYRVLNQQYKAVSEELASYRPSAVYTEAEQELLDRMIKIVSAMEKCTSNMTSAEKAYFTALVEKPEGETASAAKVSWIQPKWAVIGALLGLLGFLAIFGFAYVLSDRIKTEEEIREYFDLPLLATVGLGEAAGKKTLSEADGLSKISDRLSYAEDGTPLRSVCLAFEGKDEDAKAFSEKLGEKLKESGTGIVEAADLSEDIALNQKIAGVDGVVLIRHLKVSKSETLAKDLNSIRTSGKKVLGTVLLKN